MPSGSAGPLLLSRGCGKGVGEVLDGLLAASRPQTGTACCGWLTMTSAAGRLCACIIFTARWRGSARRSRRLASLPRRPDLSVVFMDTTSLSFEGDGGESLGEYGYSKDFWPDLQQMILGLVMDGAGWPVCTEMWPGNIADVNVLLPIVDRLRGRFGIGWVCVVADRDVIAPLGIDSGDAHYGM